MNRLFFTLYALAVSRCKNAFKLNRDKHIFFTAFMAESVYKVVFSLQKQKRYDK